MPGGTKVVLAVLGLFLGVLVVYYGFMLPGPKAGLAEPVTLIDPASQTSSEAQGLEKSPLSTPETTGDFSSRPEGLLSTFLRDSKPEDDSVPSAENPTAALGRDTLSPTPVQPTPTPASGNQSSPVVVNTALSLDLPGDFSVNESPVADAAQPANLPVIYTTYIVKEGDTLSDIASVWFGDPNKWDIISEANAGLDPRRIQIGQKLRLPPRETKRTTSRPTNNSLSVLYVVRSGDSLSRIAKKYYGDDAFWERIYFANRVSLRGDPDALKIGMRLVIPPSPNATNSPRITKLR